MGVFGWILTAAFGAGTAMAIDHFKPGWNVKGFRPGIVGASIALGLGLLTGSAALLAIAAGSGLAEGGVEAQQRLSAMQLPPAGTPGALPPAGGAAVAGVDYSDVDNSDIEAALEEAIAFGT